MELKLLLGKDKMTTQLLSRADKCLRSKARSETTRQIRREEAEERQKGWGKLSTKEKIASLKGRRGNSKKQLTRLQEVK